MFWFLVPLCYGSLDLHAQQNPQFNSYVDKVRLFEKWAVVETHTAPFQLQEGLNSLEVVGLSNDVELSSIQISPSRNVEVLNVRLGLDSVSILNYKLYKRLTDSLKILTDSLNRRNEALKRHYFLKRTLEVNNDIRVSDRSIYIDDLDELLHFYNAKLAEMDRKELRLISQVASLSHQIESISTAKKELITTLGYPRASVHVLLRARESKSDSLRLNYVTHKASWSPVYSLQLNSNQETTEISHWANVVQRTGFDWKNVELSFHAAVSPGDKFLQNTDIDKVLERAPIIGELSGRDFSGKRVKVIHGFSLNSGNEQLIRLKEENYPSGLFRYYYPALSNDVYAFAYVKGLAGDVLPYGPVSLNRDGVYVGTDSLKSEVFDDSLTFNFGPVRDLEIHRELEKDKLRKSILKSVVKQEVEFKLKIENKSGIPQEFILVDKIPTGILEDVEIDYNLPRGSEINREAKFFSAIIKVPEGETIEIQYGFQVKYPKELVIRNIYDL